MEALKTLQCGFGIIRECLLWAVPVGICDPSDEYAATDLTAAVRPTYRSAKARLDMEIEFLAGSLALAKLYPSARWIEPNFSPRCFDR